MSFDDIITTRRKIEIAELSKRLSQLLGADMTVLVITDIGEHGFPAEPTEEGLPDMDFSDIIQAFTASIGQAYATALKEANARILARRRFSAMKEMR